VAEELRYKPVGRADIVVQNRNLAAERACWVESLK